MNVEMEPVICNCACTRCLEGDCCLLPNRTSFQWDRTSTTTATFVGDMECGALDHNYAVFDETRIFCQRCGKVRAV